LLRPLPVVVLPPLTMKLTVLDPTLPAASWALASMGYAPPATSRRFQLHDTLLVDE